MQYRLKINVEFIFLQLHTELVFIPASELTKLLAQSTSNPRTSSTGNLLGFSRVPSSHNPTNTIEPFVLADCSALAHVFQPQ